MRREQIPQHILVGAGTGVMLAVLGGVPAASQGDKGSVGFFQVQAPSAKAKRGRVSGELQQLRMQQDMDRHQKDRTMRSNVSKKNEQTKKSTVRKMQ